MARRAKTTGGTGAKTESYQHPDATLVARPEAGSQARFKKKKPKAVYRYDSSLAPEMNWDGQNPAREHGEWLIACIEDAAKLAGTTPPFTFPDPRSFTSSDGRITATVRGLGDATEQLKRLSQPFLNWSGKAERLSFNVPTLPLFVHERLSTKAIIATLEGHRHDADQANMFNLFGDPQRPLADAITKAYEYQDNWVNRLILGDSLVVMNSLLEYEGLGGQVQMVYIDPPYGVNYGSNFQPFVRKREVSKNSDEDLTREPEMVKAYRDTWELGLHSYLAYLRDRLHLSRELLTQSGSIFVQISDQNLNHVTQIMDEVFGPENRCGLIAFRTTGGQSTSLLSTSTDFLVWYARDREQAKRVFQNPTTPKVGGADDGSGQYTLLEPRDYSAPPRSFSDKEAETGDIPEGWRMLAHDTLYSQGAPSDPDDVEFVWKGRKFYCPPNTHWKPGVKSGGMQALSDANRLMLVGNTLRYKRYVEDSPIYQIDNVWNDTAISGFARKKEYVVETSTKVVERCILMTTKPGDLILDPTCGSGTTAFCAERWGRRWITIDTSRVPLSLARQRLVSSVFPYFELVDEKHGPASGFRYSRKKNQRGDEVGGIVPYITLGSIARRTDGAERVIVDRPNELSGAVRVTGPFCVEATIPTPLDLDGDGEPDDGTEVAERTGFVDRMLDTLRRAPTLALGQGRNVTLKQIKQPARTLALSAEAVVDATSDGQKVSLGDVIDVADEANRGTLPFSQRPVAIVFGPEHGAVSERLVDEAAREASGKRFTHLYVIGFAIQPNATRLIDQCEDIYGVPATWVPVTPDVVMGDLLKTTRASQIFSIAGRPDVDVLPIAPEAVGDAPRWQVKLVAVNTFDPVTMELPTPMKGNDVPCWMLDTNYNGRVFMATQVFFPRTKAWENLKKALRATHDESVWDHLAGDTSAPFEAGEHATIAVKVIDDRGNELMVVRELKAAGA